jgi:hypothetical protein
VFCAEHTVTAVLLLRRAGALRGWAKALRDSGTSYDLTARHLDLRIAFLMEQEPASSQPHISWLIQEYAVTAATAAAVAAPAAAGAASPKAADGLPQPMFVRRQTSAYKAAGDATSGLLRSLQARHEASVASVTAFLKDSADLSLLKASQQVKHALHKHVHTNIPISHCVHLSNSKCSMIAALSCASV